jgi:glycosyltransferase involved in cell wall biosynthesis
VVQNRKVVILHRHQREHIKQTNAAFPYLEDKCDVRTFKVFNRLSQKRKLLKSILWLFYAPWAGRGYGVIYCDDSLPLYPLLVKLFNPRSKVIIRLGDFHLMYYFSGRTYRFLHYLEKLTWRMVDDIIAISECMALEIYKEIGRDVKVILDPVDTKYFKPMPRKNGKKIVMFHGVLTKNKNVDVMLKAARELPEINFIIIGEGPDKERLMSLAPFNCIFLGWIEHTIIPFYLNLCDIGIALRSDNPGNEYEVTSPFLQYSACGKLCLTTKRKVFGDANFQFRSVNELVFKIKQYIDKPEVGMKARECMVQYHDAEKIAGEIWSVLSFYL